MVFGSYSNPGEVYAINIDGSNVNGFPLELERTQKGVALADFNDNGKDDIVIGTESDEVYLIYDDGSIAPGFPYVTGDRINLNKPTIPFRTGIVNEINGANAEPISVPNALN